MTHPAAAVYALALTGGLLWLDRARLRWNLALWCVLPYVVAAGAWGIYIARAPQLFRLQFFGNGLGLLDPWTALALAAMPGLCLLAAIAVGRLPGWIAAAIVVAVAGVQVGSVVRAAAVNSYTRQYATFAKFLQTNTLPTDTFLADSAVGFAIGFDRQVTDDVWLGHRSGKMPDILAITPGYDQALESLRTGAPEIARHANALLAGYRPVFSARTYRIYVRKGSVASYRSF